MKIFKHAGDPDPVYAPYRLHLPPDANAALQWLRVRQPKKWRATEEEKDDPGVIAMFEKAIARVSDPNSPFARSRPAGAPPGNDSAPVPAPVPAPVYVKAHLRAPRHG
ncbi:hypothetical protein GCM10009087_42780 [Sphingomonas oligophenolica]